MAEYKKETELFKIIHEQFATDRYTYGSTIVRASSKQEAMDILNEHLSTKPDGVYTSLPCKDIKNVYRLIVLTK